MAVKRKNIAVEVRRDIDGKVYSRIIDRAIDSPYGDLTRVENKVRYVVIDRASGRLMDIDTVQNRATYISELLGVDYVEDMTWPCKAELGYANCQCPKCASKADARAKRK